jgi:hypothetical protein
MTPAKTRVWILPAAPLAQSQGMKPVSCHAWNRGLRPSAVHYATLDAPATRADRFSRTAWRVPNPSSSSVHWTGGCNTQTHHCLPLATTACSPVRLSIHTHTAVMATAAHRPEQTDHTYGLLLSHSTCPIGMLTRFHYHGMQSPIINQHTIHSDLTS